MVGSAVAIRLTTFNIQHGQSAAGDVDIALLARSCAALDADVLALQEVDQHLRRSHDADTAAEIAEACGMTFVFGEAIAIRGGRYGNALLVRGSIDDVAVLALPDEEPRSAVIARVVLTTGEELSVACTHLGRRGGAPDQLVVVLDALRARSGPRALLGDLNIGTAEVEPIAARAGFTRVASDPTFPADAPRRTIDHVLLDGLTSTAAVVPTLPVSDHRPLVVEVRSP